MAQDGSLGIGQAAKLVHADDADEFADAIANAVIDTLVPLHVAHGRKQIAESFDGTELANRVLRPLLYADNAADGSLDVTVAARLSAPRTAEDDGLAFDDAYHGVVVVHKVATRYVVVPKACVRTLARSAGSSHQIALAIASDDRSMHEHRPRAGRSKSISHHQGIVQPIVALHKGPAKERHLALREVGIAAHAAAEHSIDIVDGILIASVCHAIHAVVASATVEHAYLVALLLPVEAVVHSHREKQRLFGLPLQQEGSKRRNKPVIVGLVGKVNGKRMAANLIVVTFHVQCNDYFFFVGETTCSSTSIYSSGLKRNWPRSTNIIRNSSLWA